MIDINKIYHQDYLEGIKLIDDKSVNLIITDPPYNNLQLNGGGCLKKSYDKYMIPIHNQKMDEFECIPFLEEIKRVLKSFHAYIFCNKEMLVDYINWFNNNNYNWNLIIMSKNNPLPTCNNTYLPDKEYCFFIREKGECYFNNSLSFNYYRSVKVINIGNKETIHPAEKPVKIIKDFLKVSSKENDLILDCFVGSGSSMVACKQLNRNFIGFEVNKEYYDIANKRLNLTSKEFSKDANKELKQEVLL